MAEISFKLQAPGLLVISDKRSSLFFRGIGDEENKFFFLSKTDDPREDKEAQQAASLRDEPCSNSGDNVIKRFSAVS
jgi:hypothetical protein